VWTLRLLLALLLASPVFAQTVVNPSFEQNAPVGSWNSGPIPGWTITGSAGLWQPSTRLASPDGSATVAWSNGGSISQTVTVPANSNCTLTVYVGNRGDLPGDTSWTIQLGSASIIGTKNSIPTGTFVAETVTASESGDTPIILSAVAAQIDFDDVSLSCQPVTPPTFDILTFGVQLVNCVKCDATDNAPLTAGSIFQGASFTLTQDSQNVCKATFNAQAQATCSGPVNVTNSFVNLTPLVTSPSGTQINTGQVASFPSMLTAGAVTGNVTLILGFDATTMLPRSLQVYTN